jgi:hypothetical protein
MRCNESIDIPLFGLAIRKIVQNHFFSDVLVP